MSSDRMLWAPFDLLFEKSGEVVEDVESLARGVMGAERWPVRLEAADNDELLGHLLGESVVLETRYAPRDGIEARPWLFQRLRWAARDWLERQERHRCLAEPEPVWDLAREPSLAAAGDRGDAGLDALRRLLEGGDRALLREIAALGLSAPPGSRGRTEDARRRLAALDRKRLELVAERERVAA